MEAAAAGQQATGQIAASSWKRLTSLSLAQNGSSADAPVARRLRLSPFASVTPFGPLQDKGEEEVCCMPCDTEGDVVTR